MNVERFRQSEEFRLTLALVNENSPNAKTLLDIGAGNGISALSFALNGFEVTAVEPDESKTVGYGAIEWLKQLYKLDNIHAVKAFGEHLPFPDQQFDIVYMRQAMHHASDLEKFVKEASRVLKPGGLFLTIRDHVVYNAKDKELFLAAHPLQKFYGGENAFSAEEYSDAMRKAGLSVKRVLKYYDSPINYFPISGSELRNFHRMLRKNFIESAQKRFGSLIVYFPFLWMLEIVAQLKSGRWKSERRVPGRMYSFIAIRSLL